MKIERYDEVIRWEDIGILDGQSQSFDTKKYTKNNVDRNATRGLKRENF